MPGALACDEAATRHLPRAAWYCSAILRQDSTASEPPVTKHHALEGRCRPALLTSSGQLLEGSLREGVAIAVGDLVELARDGRVDLLIAVADAMRRQARRSRRCSACPRRHGRRSPCPRQPSEAIRRQTGQRHGRVHSCRFTPRYLPRMRMTPARSTMACWSGSTRIVEIALGDDTRSLQAVAGFQVVTPIDGAVWSSRSRGQNRCGACRWASARLPPPAAPAAPAAWARGRSLRRAG